MPTHEHYTEVPAPTTPVRVKELCSAGLRSLDWDSPLFGLRLQEKSRQRARGFNGSAAARLARSAKPCPCRPRQIGAEGTTLNCKRSDDSVPSDVAMNLLAKACGTQCRARSAESRLHRRRSDRPQAELIERAWQREKAQRAYPAESVSFIGRGGVSTRTLSSNELQEPLLVCAIQCIEWNKSTRRNSTAYKRRSCLLHRSMGTPRTMMFAIPVAPSEWKWQNSPRSPIATWESVGMLGDSVYATQQTR